MKMSEAIQVWNNSRGIYQTNFQFGDFVKSLDETVGVINDTGLTKEYAVEKLSS
jgi:hypothetical protein